MGFVVEPWVAALRWIALFGTLSLGCSGLGSSQTRAVQKPAAQPTSDANPACGVVLRAPPSPGRATELAGLADARELMVWRDQQPHSSRYASRPVRGAPFPGVAFTKVQAFAYRFAESAMLSSALPGCSAQVLSDDGRLCPSVVVKPLEPSEDQLARLLALFRLPKSKIAFGCIFNPHHAFVFFDEDGAPVADVLVCFSCGQWDLAGAGVTSMPPGAFRPLAALCEELGLGGCPVVDAADDDPFAKSYRDWRLSGALARPSSAFGIPKTRRLADMSLSDKRKLCAWRGVELQGQRFLDEDLGRYLVPPRTIRVQSFEQCVERFPRCSRSLGEVEEADLRLAEDTSLFAAPDSCIVDWVFGSKAECLWGIERQ